MIVVTGGSGFLGCHVLQYLKTQIDEQIFVPRSSQYDLRDKSSVEDMLRTHSPRLIIHLAAVCGGIGANRYRPAEFFYDNAIMGINLIHESYLHGVEKMVIVGTVCSYPHSTPIPFKETELWNGYPEETNAPYGLAKKMLLVQSQAYRSQYGFNAIYLLPVNLYGPCDNFDLETSHVIPAMIHKFLVARVNKVDMVELWGDGSPSREFLYVGDAARGIVQASLLYNKPDPINLGSGVEITIRELAHLIATKCGYNGDIIWNESYPNGQPRRCLDTTSAMREFNFTSEVSIDDGLDETIKWYTEFVGWNS